MENDVNVVVEQEEIEDDFAQWKEVDEEAELQEVLETKELQELQESDFAQKEENDSDKDLHKENALAKKVRQETTRAFNEKAIRLGFSDVNAMFDSIFQAREEDLKLAASSGDESAIDALASFKVKQEMEEMLKAEREGFAQQMDAKKMVDKHIEDFNKEYPSYALKSIEDVRDLPNAQKIFAVLKNASIDDMSLADAFLIANKSDVITGKIKAAKQSTLNKINSKQHLQPTQGNGSGNAINVPAEVMKDYIAFGFTKEEAVADFQKNMKGR